MANNKITPTEVLDYEKAKKQATGQFDPGYNQRVQGIKNDLTNRITNFQNSKVGINKNFDNQKVAQNRNNQLVKNNYSNTNLGRGMGRSSIVTSGLAGMDDRNNRVQNQIQTGRTNALGAVDSNIANAKNNTGSMLNGMEADRITGIENLVRQLIDNSVNQNRADMQYNNSIDQYLADLDFKNKQFEESQRQYNQDFAEQKRQFDLQMAAAARSGGGSRGGSSRRSSSSSRNSGTKTQFNNQFNEYLNSNIDTARLFIQNNRGEIEDRWGSQYYKEIDKKYNDKLQIYKDTVGKRTGYDGTGREEYLKSKAAPKTKKRNSAYDTFKEKLLGLF